MNLIMISGRGAGNLEMKGAFYHTLEELSKHWDRIDIICPSAGIKHGSPINSYFGNVFIHASPWPVLLQPLWIVREGLRILKTIDRRPEATRLPNGQIRCFMTVQEYPPFYNGLGAYIFSRVSGLPYMLEIHHIPGHPKAAGLKESFYRLMSVVFLGLDSVGAGIVRVVNSGQTRKFLIRAGVPAAKIKHIPSMYIDLEIFKPQATEKKYDVIFIGRFEKNKGINLYLKAVQKLGCSALIVGDGPLRGSLKSKVEKLKLDDKITFHGWAHDSSEIAVLLNQARVLVMPSYNEGGPRVVFEAMACGVPVVATPVGLVPDVLIDGQSGCIADWTAEDIASKVCSLLDDKSAYERYRTAGLEIAGRFEKKRMIRQYAESIKSLIPRV